MKETLNKGHQNVLDMQKIAETKNAGLIAFNGAIILTVIQLLTNDKIKVYFSILFNFCIILFINFALSKSHRN